MKYHISQFYRFCWYHSRGALTPAIVLALCSFKLFQICAILFEVNSGCPGTGWQSFSLYLDLLSLIDGLRTVPGRPGIYLHFENTLYIFYYNREVLVSSIDWAHARLRHLAASVSGSLRADTGRYRHRQFKGGTISSDLGPATDSCLLSLEGAPGDCRLLLWLDGRLG